MGSYKVFEVSGYILTKSWQIGVWPLWSLFLIWMYRGHVGDIADLSWSKDERFIVSGSVDNIAILWNVEK